MLRDSLRQFWFSLLLRDRAGRSTSLRRASRGVALLAGLLPAQAAPAPYSVRLDARACQAAPSRAASLGPAWQTLAAYVQDCPVRGPDGRRGLTVVIVRVDRVYARFVHQRIDFTIPDPVLLGPGGTRLGQLPEGFPVDPPGALRVRFVQWRDGLPRRIDLYEAGESALPPHALDPMRWDPAGLSYR